MELSAWEDHFRKCSETQTRDFSRAGALLPIIPGYKEWHQFLDVMKETWEISLRIFEQNPHCIVVLYGGLAFYEYEDGCFWPHFERAVAQRDIPPNKQKEINMAFAHSAEKLGLRVFRYAAWTDYVGSAVFHIGVPLSLWDGFLEICEWALWCEDWNRLSDQEWEDITSRRAAGRHRLGRFLKDNREAATAAIHEMLEARRVFGEDGSLTLDDLKRLCFIRPEYFDYVPETADFLRPANPHSLLLGRPRIRWNRPNMDRAEISIRLPPVRDLPAEWHVGDISQPAQCTADSIPLNSSAFQSTVTLALGVAHGGAEEWVLRGADPWAIFDITEGWMVNRDRQRLPLRAYDILSQRPLASVRRQGFNEEDYEPNEVFELKDDTYCYCTHLDPTRRTASLSFVHDNSNYRLYFAETSKLETHVYPGNGYRSAFFRWFDRRMKLTHLPLVCVGIPHDYLHDVLSFLNEKLTVCVDDTPVKGEWKHYYEDKLRDFWMWTASNSTVGYKGKKSLTVSAPGIGIIENRILELENSKPGMDEAWKQLPGDFLPWFILCQKPGGMSWSEIEHAQNAIEPGSEVRYWLLRKYAQHGFFRQQGHKWSIAESRAALTKSQTGECEVRFCGNPCVLWTMLRHINDKYRTITPPVIEVARERGFPPFLFIRWEGEFEADVFKYLKTHEVKVVSNLWEETRNEISELSIRS